MNESAQDERPGFPVERIVGLLRGGIAAMRAGHRELPTRAINRVLNAAADEIERLNFACEVKDKTIDGLQEDVEHLIAFGTLPPLEKPNAR